MYRKPVEKKRASYQQMSEAELETYINSDVYAMHEYARRQEGKGDIDHAISCYEAAGDMGLPYSYYCGGVLAEEHGYISCAARMYKKGHKQGEKWSTYRLGCMYYYKDIFTPFPRIRAEECFHYAALNGISNAQAKYADILMSKFSNDTRGRGPDSANFWLACALLNNDHEAEMINQRVREGLSPSILSYYDERLDEIKESIIESYPQLLDDSK